VDIGTSGVRATLFDEVAAELSECSVRIDRTTADDHFDISDPDAIVEAVISLIDKLFATIPIEDNTVELIAISCFWHSLVGVNAAERARTPVLGWSDTRASAAARQLRSTFDEVETHVRTGCRFHPSYWPAKLLWMRERDAANFSGTNRWLSVSEFLTMRLFGSEEMSLSMASGTGLMNLQTCEWDSTLLQALRISADSLPTIAADGPSNDKLKPAYAARWPQLANARLCPAIADGAANNIGAGCTSRDKLALMIGTSGATRVLYTGDLPSKLPKQLWCYRADRKRVVVGGALSDGGGLYQMLKDSLLPNEDHAAIQDELMELEPDAHGLTVLPFWSGERSTGWSLTAKGGIFGLTSKTKPIEILLAGMEAVAYRFALMVRALDEISPNASVIAAGNALQSSQVWLQIIADVLGRPVTLSATREASSRGAALLALEAAGKIPNIEKAVNAVGEKTVEPDPFRHSVYQKAIERQEKLYEKTIETD
jgi:gluconokinase